MLHKFWTMYSTLMKFHTWELTHLYINIGSLTMYLMAVDIGDPIGIASFPTCGFCGQNGLGRHNIQRHYDLKRHKHADSNPNIATTLWFVGFCCTQIQSGKICSWDCWGLQDSTGLSAIRSRVSCLCWPTLCHDRTEGDFVSHSIQVLLLTITGIPPFPCIQVGYCTWTWSYSLCEESLTSLSFEKDEWTATIHSFPSCSFIDFVDSSSFSWCFCYCLV